MKSLFSSPLRVYLCLGALALAGILCGMKLPISLFPNSSRPEVSVRMNYGSSTAEEFMNNYGTEFEEKLRAINAPGVEVEKLTASYDPRSASYNVLFKWGTNPQTALKEVQTVVTSYTSQMPRNVQETVGVWINNENSGFFAMTFYSKTRSLDELYGIMEPVLMSAVAKNQETSELYFFNPARREVRIELSPEKLASLRLLPANVAKAISYALSAQGAGTVTIGSNQFSAQVPREASDIESLRRLPIVSPTGRTVHLGDIATVELGPELSRSRVFKTSGAPSLMLYATPKPGGNIKKMSEELLKSSLGVLKQLPKDIQYKVLVDPSEFIRASVSNVIHEVLLGALLAVFVLYLFIGSFRNTVTAAIEIPLSMVLAFILMKLSGMNLNLISLGGLALSAGMNVDASVVVMENIFRHFEHVTGTLNARERLEIVIRAVKEVWFAVVASTISSLVVFLPLAFTSDLSYAILGDLAKTVIFSHGFSAIVALILVPTVRLQLMSGKNAELSPVSPIEGSLKKLENGYVAGLKAFLTNRKLRWGTYVGAAAALALLAVFALPRLPKEIIGRPDSDFMFMRVSARGNTLMRQTESQIDEVEARLLAKFSDKIQYTYVQVWGAWGGSIMARLKNKKDMDAVWKAMEAEFVSTPLLRFNMSPWNPAELPIPDPPQLRVLVTGGSIEERAEKTRAVLETLEEKQIVANTWAEPNVTRTSNVILRPHWNQWINGSTQIPFSPADLADLVRVATDGARVGEMSIDGRNTLISLRFPQDRVSSLEEVGALPLGIGTRIVPLRSFVDVRIEDVAPTIYREDGRESFLVLGNKLQTQNIKTEEVVKKSQEILKGFDGLVFEDAQYELNDAIRQLGFAVGLSILLIFFTMVLQFGSMTNALLVLVAVPLGLLGVLASLTVFRSTLSLNSILGIILLNGIAVANSIILVDFIKRLAADGLSPTEAALEAGRKRLRPILITSLTTILGMMPIALGWGEGGKILQPLGIAVSGGLWVSMSLTLFIVPALQVATLERNKSDRPRSARWIQRLPLPLRRKNLSRNPEWVSELPGEA